MTTVVEFRLWRNKADAARMRARPSSAPSDAPCPASEPFAGADIILMPLAWLRQIARRDARKPLRRRFAMHEPQPA